ncbi:uncharacterized protein ZBAI_06725 [Zygosaccharomyces bailii ISA1307]|nr:uncharacterized protein ZBAI_06725 [Zygosaccharomyces bailii ISA1307]
MRASPLSVSWYICGSIFWAAQRSSVDMSGSSLSRNELVRRVAAQSCSAAWCPPEDPCQARVNCRCCTRFTRQDRQGTHDNQDTTLWHRLLAPPRKYLFCSLQGCPGGTFADSRWKKLFLSSPPAGRDGALNRAG